MAIASDPDLNSPSSPNIGLSMQVGYGVPVNLGSVTPGSNIHQEIIPMGEETIQIAPHPTTNRFPWAPVENPKVPVFQTVFVSDPTAPGEGQPLPRPVTQPPSAHAAPPPVSQSQPAEPVMPLVPSLTPPPSQPLPASPAPAAEVTQPGRKAQVPTPPLAPQVAPGRAKSIYSEYTREVWRVFRPSKAIKYFLYAMILLVIGGVIGIWLMSGASTDIMSVPFIRQILSAQ